MSVAQHNNRCVNFFREPGKKGHVGKSLRKMSGRILQQFPNLPSTSKICSNCYKRFQTEMVKNDLHIDESNNSTFLLSFGDSSIEMVVDTSYTSDDDKDSLISNREQKLEEMLNGLKEKFNNLNWNDPLRLRILTTAPSSWSIRKIAKEFNRLDISQQNQKN